ncbi:MAG: polyprenyl synthetase family protein [Bacteroidales bacterium]|nr:polyprenyl synthetase family protein [Bacteroidales bacterium]
MYTQDELSDIIQKGIDQIQYPTLAPRLYEPVRYTMESGGKRLRPLLALMATNLFKEDITPALQPALGIEMYHNFTLLHDDVMDKAPERRGRATVHVKWNDNTAILSGDAMQALAYQLIAEAPAYCLKSVLDVFNTTNIEIDEGQQLDMEFESRNDVQTEEYIEMIRLKTSVLLGCALKVGALIGEATPTQVKALYDFGINLGLAFQLQDDWLDCWGDPRTFGKRIGGDILCDKKTYLRILAEKAAPIPSADKTDEQQYIETVKQYYVETGAEQACRDAIAYYVAKAKENLQELNLPDEKVAPLRTFVGKLENRKV